MVGGHPQLHRTCPLSGGKADMTFCGANVGFDPKRTLPHFQCARLTRYDGYPEPRAGEEPYEAKVACSVVFP
jgi:hypothetical protein